jgi:hypothetical protein
MALIAACVFKRDTIRRLNMAKAYKADIEYMPPCKHAEVAIFCGNQTEHARIFVGAINRMVYTARIPPDSHLVSLFLQRASFLSGVPLHRIWSEFYTGGFTPKSNAHLYTLTGPDMIRQVFATRLSLLGLDTPLWNICETDATIANGVVVYKHLLGLSNRTRNTREAVRDARIIHNMLISKDPMNISPTVDCVIPENDVWRSAIVEAFRIEPSLVMTTDMRQVGGLCMACMQSLATEGDRLVRPWEYQDCIVDAHTCGV